MEIWKNLEIWLKFGNWEKVWKFGKKIGNLEKRLEIWKEIENLENIWKFEKKNLKIWKKNGNLKKS